MKKRENCFDFKTLGEKILTHMGENSDRPIVSSFISMHVVYLFQIMMQPMEDCSRAFGSFFGGNPHVSLFLSGSLCVIPPRCGCTWRFLLGDVSRLWCLGSSLMSPKQPPLSSKPGLFHFFCLKDLIFSHLPPFRMLDLSLKGCLKYSLR